MPRVNRRDLLRASGLGLLGTAASGWLPALADEFAADPRRRRHCVLLWMVGGPSQTDTFDMKPGHRNGGEFKEIQTSASGLRISEHLPQIAKMGEHLAVIRSLSTKEGDHERGTFVMRTGYQPTGPVRYPAIGASLSKQLGSDTAEVPNYVSISPYTALSRAAYSPGFLGPRYAPLTVGATDPVQPGDAQPSEGYAQLRVDDLRMPGGVELAQADARLGLWQTLQGNFLARHRTASPLAHDTVYQRAVRMMRSDAARAFDLDDEPDSIREAYGRGRFGQGCLMARRLIERGVPFVEVSLGTLGGNSLGWDTHQNNFQTVKRLSAELDAGWGTLMRELKDRDLLESTTILWMGEFGRTPAINATAGRDHFPAAWSCVLAGGGIRGGQAYGRTSDDGTRVEEGKVDVGNVLATLCKALGVDPGHQNISELGRPIAITEGQPIDEVLA
jgi:hypothetical protein